MPNSLVVLIESADRALDDEQEPMNDWEFVNNYNVKTWQIKTLNRLAQLPCIGRTFKLFMYEALCYSYDISVNFIEAHETATKMIQGIIYSEEFVNVII